MRPLSLCPPRELSTVRTDLCFYGVLGALWFISMFRSAIISVRLKVNNPETKPYRKFRRQQGTSCYYKKENTLVKCFWICKWSLEEIFLEGKEINFHVQGAVLLLQGKVCSHGFVSLLALCSLCDNRGMPSTSMQSKGMYKFGLLVKCKDKVMPCHFLIVKLTIYDS